MKLDDDNGHFDRQQDEGDQHADAGDQSHQDGVEVREELNWARRDRVDVVKQPDADLDPLHHNFRRRVEEVAQTHGAAAGLQPQADEAIDDRLTERVPLAHQPGEEPDQQHLADQ